MVKRGHRTIPTHPHYLIPAANCHFCTPMRESPGRVPIPPSRKRRGERKTKRDKERKRKTKRKKKKRRKRKGKGKGRKEKGKEGKKRKRKGKNRKEKEGEEKKGKERKKKEKDENAKMSPNSSTTLVPRKIPLGQTVSTSFFWPKFYTTRILNFVAPLAAFK